MSTEIDNGSPGKVDAAKEQGARVAGTAAQQTQEVAGTAKDQAGRVVGEARDQAQRVAGDAAEHARGQIADQQNRLATLLSDLSRELGSMAESGSSGSTARSLVDDASRHSERLAGYLRDREPGDLMRDVQNFGRRRPGAFLLVAAVAGAVVGRLGKAVKEAPDNTGAQQGSLPATTGPATTPAPVTATPPVTYPVESGYESTAGSTSTYPTDPIGSAPLGSTR